MGYIVIDGTLKQILFIYVAFTGAILATYPVINLIISTFRRGTAAWK